MKPLLLFVALIPLLSFSQMKEIKVSDNLTLTKLSKGVYIHTCDHSNGLVYVVGKEAAIISTSPTDTATIELIHWVKKELKATVKFCIVDHWHPDAMEGVDVMHKEGISTYSHTLTQEIAKSKGLAAPQNGFNDSFSIELGNKKIITRYFGPAHTADGIVVWLPEEKLLFGGCEVKSNGGWVGNIADAYLTEWSRTVEKVKISFPYAEIVLPGHGVYGDTSLLTYTINLIQVKKPDSKSVPFPLPPNANDDYDWEFYYDIKKHKREDDKTEDIIIINKDSVIFSISSPVIQFNKKIFIAEQGFIAIIDKKTEYAILYFKFKKLELRINETEPKLTLVIKEFVKE